MKSLNRTILSFGLIAALAACSKNDRSHVTVASSPTPVKTTCAADVITIATDFPYAPSEMDQNVFDDSLDTYVTSDVVAPGDQRHIDIDYGCTWTFHKMMLHYDTYAFGSVTIYSADSPHGPFNNLVASYDSSSAPYSGGYWYANANVTTRYVRYVFTNSSGCDTQFKIGDIEAEATYISDN